MRAQRGTYVYYMVDKSLMSQHSNSLIQIWLGNFDTLLLIVNYPTSYNRSDFSNFVHHKPSHTKRLHILCFMTTTNDN